MQKALNEAWKYQFLTYPNPAVGACVVKNNKILATKAHKQAGGPHAEVLALKSAYLLFYPNSPLKNLITSQEIHNFLISNHKDFFKDLEIYVTLEPCNHIGKTPSCANLLKQINIKKVYIGILDPNNTASGGVETLKKSGIEVEYNILKKQCDELLYPFKKWQSDSFKFFKIASRDDGTIDGGYITTQDSLNLVHEIRTKLDLLIIGGNTVRIDKPTLDTRFAKINNPPNILIYSKQEDFDKNIKLFKVKNRDVIISDNLEEIKSNFSMIEGGHNLLETLKDKVDMVMIFVSHKNKSGKYMDIISKYKLKKLYSYYINKIDEVIFYTKLN